MSGRAASRGSVPGSLGPWMGGFAVHLERLGYTPGSACIQMGWVRRLSIWMADEGLPAEALAELVAGQFLAAWAGPGRVPSVRMFGPLLGWLRELEVIAPPAVPPPGRHDELLGRYRQWLTGDRGLADRTISRYVITARRFLEQAASGEPGDAGVIARLTGREVTGFLLAEAGRGLAAGSVKGRVAELRSLLRFLHVSGLIPAALDGCVPPVAGWRGTVIPPRTPTGPDVAAMLATCDRGTPSGQRDFAILTVLARLGLRASEITALQLGDIDWRAGEIIIRGKGRREDRLPLPADAGAAIAAYLSSARPAAACRNVFITRHAPARPMHPNTVGKVVLTACKRAGLPPVRSHRLRHALAAELLRRGAALPEISQLLRHRDLATTAIYAKVDLDSLRQVAAPWTGAGR